MSSQGSSSKIAANDTNELHIIFTLHLPREPEENNIRKFTKWIDSLDRKIGLGISGVYRANSTMMVLECNKSKWYTLEGKEGFKYFGKTYGTNLCRQKQEALRELPTSKPLQGQKSSMGLGLGGRLGILPHAKSAGEH